MDRLLVVGAEPCAAIRSFCAARGLPAPDDEIALELGAGLTLTPSEPAPTPFAVIAGICQRRRHIRKYAEGRLGEDKSFYFRGADGRLNLRAHNLTMFVELASGVDESTWQYHRDRGDYSRWVAEAIKDPDLADEMEHIESSKVSAAEARVWQREAIERRYTLPA